jgi:threonine/homoserine/homoserine lactone efflux protein
METLISFFISSVLLTLAPGPDLFMVIGQSIEKGFRPTFTFILGLISGLCFHTLLLVFGWAQFIGDRPEVVTMIKVLGALYFFVVGGKVFFKSNQTERFSARNYKTSNGYFKGLIMSSINPKVSLFFWLFFPGFLFNSNWSISYQYLILGGLFLFQALIVFSTVAYFTSYFSSFIYSRKMEKYNGCLFLMIGLYLLVS